MADIFGGVEPPAWLSRIAQPADTGVASQVVGTIVGGLVNAVGDSISAAKKKNAEADVRESIGQPSEDRTSWLGQLPSHLKGGLFEARMNMADPFWEIKKRQAELNIAHTGAQTANLLMEIDERKQGIVMDQHDRSEMSEWLKRYPTWESRQSAPPPTLFTPQFQQSYHGMILQDGRSLQAKAITDASKDYQKSVDEGRRLGIDVSEYAKHINGQVPPGVRDELNKKIADKKSEDAAAKAAAVQQKETLKEAGKTKEAREKSFTKSVETLRGLDAAAAAPFESLIGQEPSPQQWDALSTALGKAQKGKEATKTFKPSESSKSDEIYARERLNRADHNLFEAHKQTGKGAQEAVDRAQGEWFEAKKYYNRALKNLEAPAPATPVQATPAAADPMGLYAPSK
jgi:hypothetical protein